MRRTFVISLMLVSLPVAAQQTLLGKVGRSLSRLITIEHAPSAPVNPPVQVAQASLPDSYAKVLQVADQVEYFFPEGRKTADGITIPPDMGWAGLRLGASRHEAEKLLGTPLKLVRTRIDHGDFINTESTAATTWKGREITLSFDGSTLAGLYVDLPELRGLSPAQVEAAEARIGKAAPKDDAGDALYPPCQSEELSRERGRLDLTTDDCD